MRRASSTCSNPRILGPDGHGQTGNGVDGFKGYNVLTYRHPDPAELAAAASPTTMRSPAPRTAWVSTPRSAARASRCAALSGDPPISGPWIQVNRLGNPLFNEVLVALKDKDNYNRDVPDRTMRRRYKTYA